jgi:hypothetical protein
LSGDGVERWSLLGSAHGDGQLTLLLVEGELKERAALLLDRDHLLKGLAIEPG